jgi:hypothetical protein
MTQPSIPQQQQRIDELAEAVNILGGQVAALMAYVAAVTVPFDATKKGQVQGAAQRLAPAGIPSRTPPMLAASQGVDKILWLAQQLQKPAQP